MTQCFPLFYFINKIVSTYNSRWHSYILVIELRDFADYIDIFPYPSLSKVFTNFSYVTNKKCSNVLVIS